MNVRKPIAFLTMESLKGFFTYDTLAAEVLRARGHTVDFVPWRRAADWEQYACVVIRSPWDYQRAPHEFLAALRAIDASGTRLLNPLPVVEWNIDKRYLLELEAAGIPIVPTRVLNPLTPELLRAFHREQAAQEYIVKPVIGANAQGAFRLLPPFTDEATRNATAYYATQPCLLQPFVRSIIGEGEFSVFYFLDQFSHAIVKRPATGDFRVQEEHGGQIEAIAPGDELRTAADRALAAIPFHALLYARIDLVRLADGRLAVMEIELIEPSLYFQHDAKSPTHFADAVESVLRSRAC